MYTCIYNDKKTMHLLHGRILIRFEWHTDEYPDTSFYGYYSSKPEKGYIDRKERGDWNNSTDGYRYFIPAMRQEIYDYYIEKGWHPRAARIEAGYVSNQAYKAMESIQNGDIVYLYYTADLYIDGVKVGAESLCNIESSSPDDLTEYENEAVSILLSLAQKELRKNGYKTISA